MSTKKDMRRPDLVVPYQAAEKDEGSTDFQSTMTSTLPMAAIFTRNKLLGWTAILFAIQSWLSETPAQKAAASSPAYLQVGMAALSLGVGYMPLFMPPVGGARPGAGSGTEAPAPSP
ncbi:Putative PAT complex subunit Asterix [Septoria linicola]|uniref:PAT complex subunit Asterix n=1 Tax=Septoria linicola TaxID=215465 RepID=A0A9Q9ARC0_9PEZI|nr:putative PAT complex subunit Asterix [Septoria linicola]USW50631.1 Putative PAT complex subunit Asterix [Septoria linicola]